MEKLTTIFLTGIALAAAGAVDGGTIQVNLACGYFYDGVGTTPAHRLPPGTLFVLVADLAGDGFDPLDGDWVSGDDELVTVFDAEFPQAGGGTKGFDLASGSTEAGLFSRSLGIDPAQFAGRTAPIPVALRWFPGSLAAGVNLAISKPATGSPYGEFFRITPLHGGIGWSLPLSAGASLSPDPFATSDFGGLDPAAGGMARWRVLSGGRPEEPRLELTATGIAKLSFRGAPATRYQVQRSENLILWEDRAAPNTDIYGACVWEDPAPALDRAFYRVNGPLPGP